MQLCAHVTGAATARCSGPRTVDKESQLSDKGGPQPRDVERHRDTSAGQRWEKPLKLCPLSPPSRLWPGCQAARRMNGPEGRGKHNSALWQPNAFSSGQSSLHLPLSIYPEIKFKYSSVVLPRNSGTCWSQEHAISEKEHLRTILGKHGYDPKP